MLPIATGVRNPPDPTSAAPGISMLAIRFGPQDQTAREFRTFGGFWRLRGIQKSLKKHGGIRGHRGGRAPTRENRTAVTTIPRNLARFAANQNPPDPTPATPGVAILATRFGAQGPTPRSFWKFGGFRKLREFRKSPKNNGGAQRHLGGRLPTPEN